MRLVHDANGEREPLASDIEIADGLVSQTRGLMFKRSIADGYGLAFSFETAKARDIHMLFVFMSLDVIWIHEDVVQRVETLRPWRGFAKETADLIIELPAGTASDVEVGDEVLLEDSDDVLENE
ncbi:DUF192 domain-containing protein [Halostagnicola sp. A-GB9-2]|uniref:DUF192 domain-containing protein n=1 Tax=Halostagnicola sp. A-GB9-2 TaxID=3048066 RepID=UPI0024BFE52F|nr:DUF192 domain-containing protein [Halostagnicola sp. A-GB9-2]MDJ1431713.1 DUF192 domain-containing protein [Halostagnicola sp. A-GB9-2]